MRDGLDAVNHQREVGHEQTANVGMMGVAEVFMRGRNVIQKTGQSHMVLGWKLIQRTGNHPACEEKTTR